MANEVKSVNFGMCKVDGLTNPGTPVFLANSGIFNLVQSSGTGVYAIGVDTGEAQLDLTALQTICYPEGALQYIQPTLANAITLGINAFTNVGVAADAIFSCVLYGVSGAQAD